LSQTRGPYHKHIKLTQEHKKRLAITHYRIGISTQSTLVGTKH